MDMYRHRWIEEWRKGWDSNPRYPCRHAGFQDRCLKPLGHPSKPLPLLSFLRNLWGKKPPFATALLPNCFGALVYGGSERIVNKSGCVILHPRHHMRIQVQRDPDLAVAKALTGHLWVDTVRQHVSGMGMAQIMEPDAGQGGLG